MFSLKFLKDLVERVVWTAVQAFGATALVLDGGIWSATNLKIAGTAAVVAAVKAVVASRVGDKDTASLGV